MYAMIGTCIAMAIWTSGLLYMTLKTEKNRLAVIEEQIAFDKTGVIGIGQGHDGDVKV
jgi:MFS transporter, ACS family, pantothenate transporter